MDKVLIKRGGREFLYEPRRVDLEELVADVSSLGYEVDLDFGPEPQPGKYGLTYAEIALIYLGTKIFDGMTSYAIDEALKKLTHAVVEWAKLRFQKHPENARPQYVSIFGPQGEILKSVQVDRTGDVEDLTEKDRARRARRRR